MTKTIYVPQGYCARLTTATKSYGIGGLYTDGISTCNILACISNDRIVLAHIDNQTLFFWNNNLKQEIEDIKDLREIVIISRENETLVKHELIKLINSFKPQLSIIEKEIDLTHDGIYISFDQQNNHDIHPNLKKYPIRSREGLDLIHHPQEQEIEAVQKIHQIIGVDAKLKTKEIPNKNFFIFDGRAWEPMDKAELAIDNSHSTTCKEINFFKKSDSYIVVQGKLWGILKSMEGDMPFYEPPEKLATQVTPYMEGYLSNFDPSLLFKRNLKDMINSDAYRPETQEDKHFKENLIKILYKNKDVYSEVQDLYSVYKNTTPETKFRIEVTREIHTFSRHYQERKYYHDLKLKYKEIENQATTLNEQAVEGYKNNNFQSAADLFFKAIQLYTCCSMKNDPKLASLYYNCGRSLQQLGEYNEAKFFLNTSLILRENYIEPRPTAEIEKTKKAIDECKKAQGQPSTTWVESLSISRTASNFQGLGK